jgi:dTDP-4-amino-4,6-dideoxygalactose transaminase
MRLRVSKSVVGEAEAAAVSRVVENGFFGMGNETRAFESELAAFFGGGRDVVCVNTGTSALHLAAQACGIGPGDEVICATMTFIATFQAVAATGATVVPADVRESDCWLDLADVERRITPRTKAVVPVHFAGGPGDLDALFELADRYGLRVIEDAAHAFGSAYDGTLVGARGDVVCFSFDGLKNITAGEGGAVVTGDHTVAEKVREGRLLGIHSGSETRLGGQRWDFDVFDQGWRYHLSDLFAAIGRAQLRRFEDEFKPRRLELARRYDDLFAGLPNLEPMSFDYDQVVPFIYVVRVTNGLRDRARDALIAGGVECGLNYKPLHLLTRYGRGAPSLPAAERIYGEVLTLPLHIEISEADQDLVATLLASAVGAGAPVRS